MKSHASMNRIYRLVFNAALGIWVAVAENAKGRGKGGRAACALIAVLAIISPSAYAANAADARVVVGSGSVATTGLATTINQTSQRLAIDWTQLSTAANEALKFNQPNAQAIALNRITGSSPSSFLGSLTANGQVFILNPNGVLFGAGSQVNVGGLVASTLAMSNADFQAGRNVFTNSGGTGSVVNQGTMTATQGGYLALLAPEVRNEGVMTASLGTALLAAGNKVTLNLDNGSLLGYSIDQGAINALAENKQLIKADGGQVLLSAKALDALTTATVNNTGVIEARTIQNKAGRIMLMGDMEHGTVNVGGTLDASAPNGGDGGFIETSAAHVKVATGTRVTTHAAAGQTGKWLIDPNDFTIAASGGDMTAADVVNNLATTNFEIQTATMGTTGNGDIHVNEALSWSSAQTLTLTAERNININQAITATNGGLTLNSTGNGAISAPAAVNVGTFTLVNGRWSQIGTLPTFSATDFRISGGTFIRALGGDGLSPVTAYQLTDVYGLQGAGSAGMLNKHYKLANDIDASGTATWNGGAGGAGFKPIGDSTYNYYGAFDGNYKTISNLTINRPGAFSVGMFGQLGSGSEVRNVGLFNASVSGRDRTGALAGSNAGTITSSYVTGNVFATGSWVGGLVGLNSGTIGNSYSTSRVQGADFVGGLTGSNSGSIDNSYATGFVQATNFNFGGLVASNSRFVSNSFWNTQTSGQSTSAGGTGKTTAEMQQAATFTNVGWSANNAGGGGTVWRIYEGQSGPLLRGFLTAYNLTPDYEASGTPMANIGSYSTAGADMSKLLGTAAATDNLTLGNTGAAGSYTATSSAAGRFSHQQGYDITSTRSISTLGSSAGDVRLDNDISYTNGTLAIAATGNIDLNGKAITSARGALRINGGTAINAGAVNVDVFNLAAGTWQQVGSTPAAFAARDFGISGGTFIRALGGDGLTEAYLLTDAYGLQGAGSAGMLSKHYQLANSIDASGTIDWNGGAGFKPIGNNTTRFTGTFNGDNKTISLLTINRPTENHVGLFGFIAGSSIVTNVGLFRAGVNGASYVGGLIGYLGSGSISNSYVTGNVTGENVVGGLAGSNGGSISNSYATANVTASNPFAGVGGLVGSQGFYGSVSNSYSSGAVSGTGGLVGGLIGELVAPSGVSNSFWNTDTSGRATSAGGTGKTTTQMKQASTFSAWSIATTGGSTNIWRIYEGSTGPLLRGFLTGLTVADTAVTYNGGTQVGATTSDARVLGGSNASARNAGSYTTGYYSDQRGVDIIGGGLTVNKANLVLSTRDVAKAYDGNMSAMGTAVTKGGTQLFTTDTATGGTFAFTNKNASVGNKAVTASGVTVNDGNSGNNYNVSYVDNTTSTIIPKGLTISGITADNKTYDQNDSATVNTTGAAYSGLIGGDVLSVSATGVFTDKNAATGKTVNLTSSYTGADVGNYAITDQATTTADIAQKALTISGITASNKTYDQGTGVSVRTADAAYSGLIAGDLLAVNATGAFTDKNAAIGKTVNLTSSYVGADVGNYAITDQATTTANIAQKALTVSDIMADNKVYDQGTGVVVTTAGASYSGLIAGDLLAVSASGTFTDKNAAIGKTVNLTSSYLGADVGNYAITDQATTTANITPKALTVSGLTAANRTYDQTTNATVSTSGAVYSGLIAGDALTVSATGVFLYKGAAIGKTVNLTSSYTGADVSNYAITDQATTTADVGRKALMISGITAANKTYDRGTGATVSTSGAVYSGLIAGDALTVSAAGTFIDKNAATGKTVDLSSSFFGADVSNYDITRQVETTADIAQKALTVSGITAANKTYDQGTGATVSTAGAAYSGLIAGDALTVSATGAFTDKNAATGKTVNLASSYLGADVANYAITDQASTTANITPKDLTVTAAAQNKVYNATTAATLTYTDNRIAGDALSFTSSASFADKNAGTAKTVNYSGLAQTGLDANNYNLVSPTSGTSSADITRAPLSVTSNNDTRTAGGAAYTGGNGVVFSGLVGGEASSVLTGALTYGGTSQGASAAGSYAITPGGLASGNYAVSFADGSLLLTPAPVLAPPNSAGPLVAALGGTALVPAFAGVLQSVANVGASPVVNTGGIGGGAGSNVVASGTGSTAGTGADPGTGGRVVIGGAPQSPQARLNAAAPDASNDE